LVDDVKFTQQGYLDFERDPNNKIMKGDIGGAAW